MNNINNTKLRKYTFNAEEVIQIVQGNTNTNISQSVLEEFLNSSKTKMEVQR